MLNLKSASFYAFTSEHKKLFVIIRNRSFPSEIDKISISFPTASYAHSPFAKSPPNKTRNNSSYAALMKMGKMHFHSCCVKTKTKSMTFKKALRAENL